MALKIGMVLERDFPTTPPDLRVEKEARTLIEAGHEVHLLSLLETSVAAREQRNGVNIVRVPIPMLRIADWTPANVKSHFYSRQSPWVQATRRFVAANRIDVLHVHDLPLVWPVATAAREMGLPVVFDMHEIYPPMVAFMRPGTGDRWRPAHWAAQYEDRCLRLVDHVITVVDESRQRLIDRGVAADKISVVMNTEPNDPLLPEMHQMTAAAYQPKDFVVTYVGTFGRIRGLERLIEAATKIYLRVPIQLLLVGGQYNQAELEELAVALHVRDRVNITGFVDFDSVWPFIAASDVCVVPHVKNAFTDATIPHKLFQYMRMGKPVVVSDAAPLQRIVAECNCGYIFPSGSSDELAQALEWLANHPEEGRQLGENGRQAVLTRYNWDHDAHALLTLYQRVAGRLGRCTGSATNISI